MTDRFIVADARVDARRWKLGMLEPHEEQRIDEAEERFHKHRRIIIDDKSHLTVPLIRAVGRQTKREYGRLDAVMIDYGQKLRPATEMRNRTRQDELQAISGDLQMLAKPDQLNCPVICFLQASRNVEQRKNKRVTLADLRESGAWEQDGRVVLGLYRDSVYGGTEGDEIEILKNNEGRALMSIPMTFVEGYSRWENYYRGKERVRF